jgi:DNA repair protein RadA/Sms
MRCIKSMSTKINKIKVMKNQVKRGRPRKVVETTTMKLNVKTVKMNDLNFDKKLFEPMKTGTKVDAFFSMEGGVMPGTNVVITGDPGVGKTTVLLDVIGDLQKNGKKCLFISGEMNAIDMVGYVRRFPKFGELDILFMGDYSEVNPDVVLRTALKEGYDCVLIDSLAEISDNYVDYFGGTGKSNTNRILQLLDEHNQANNNSKTNTTFLIIQQVTKSGTFVGSNKIKHMTTAMGHLKFDGDGQRFFHFSKNRRGGNGNKLFFNLESKNKVNWLFDEPLNMI